MPLLGFTAVFGVAWGSVPLADMTPQFEIAAGMMRRVVPTAGLTLADVPEGVGG
jgi:hypothetical protein